jgi:hypothetical protein
MMISFESLIGKKREDLEFFSGKKGLLSKLFAFIPRGLPRGMNTCLAEEVYKGEWSVPVSSDHGVSAPLREAFSGRRIRPAGFRARIRRVTVNSMVRLRSQADV